MKFYNILIINLSFLDNMSLYVCICCQSAGVYPSFWQHDLKTTECGPQGFHPWFPVTLRYPMHRLNDCNDVTIFKSVSYV